MPRRDAPPAAALVRERHHRMLRTALGPVIADLLEQADVTDVLLNPDGKLWVGRLGAGRSATGAELSPADAERIVRLIASHMGVEVHRERPMIEAELPETGERFHGALPPVASQPTFAIRKPAARIYPLADYVSAGIMTAFQAGFLRQAVWERKNILIAGGTGGGKTTLANALLLIVAETGHRVVILEDRRELQCAAADVVALRTKPGIVSLADLVRFTLGFWPDRIVVGEFRGGEALDLLKAWGTGHPGGLATMHANTAASTMVQLEQLLLERVVTVPRALIAEAIDVVVWIGALGGRRRVETIAELRGLRDGTYDLRPIETPGAPLASGMTPGGIP
jgi:P-type conjugative transfer ATPase TrbB